ncbi:alpha/beta hydrolase [soil metagenome]
MKKSISLSVLFLLVSSFLYAQAGEATIAVKAAAKPTRVLYKTVDGVNLYLHLYYPSDFNPRKTYPVLLFFFGGGWQKGSYRQFEPHAEYFSGRGLISVLADYRIASEHQTTPFDAVRDAKSAIRYVREHAEELNMDPSRIAAAGGSAGGHLAAAAGNVPGLEEAGENRAVSSKPNGLVLFNPVFDNGPGGYGYERIRDRYREISPLHNIRPGAPPTIVFLGTKDQLVPVATARAYQKKMEKVGSRCELLLYEGQPHGFFNYANLPFYKKTVYEADRFLQSIGFLEGPPTIQPE